MIECPRCGNQAEYLPGGEFVLVWCDFCMDEIEVGGLALHDRPDAPARAPLREPVAV
jgi:hypothetical protein